MMMLQQPVNDASPRSARKSHRHSTKSQRLSRSNLPEMIEGDDKLSRWLAKTADDAKQRGSGTHRNWASYCSNDDGELPELVFDVKKSPPEGGKESADAAAPFELAKAPRVSANRVSTSRVSASRVSRTSRVSFGAKGSPPKAKSLDMALDSDGSDGDVYTADADAEEQAILRASRRISARASRNLVVEELSEEDEQEEDAIAASYRISQRTSAFVLDDDDDEPPAAARRTKFVRPSDELTSDGTGSDSDSDSAPAAAPAMPAMPASTFGNAFLPQANAFAPPTFDAMHWAMARGQFGNQPMQPMPMQQPVLVQLPGQGYGAQPMMMMLTPVPQQFMQQPQPPQQPQQMPFMPQQQMPQQQMPQQQMPFGVPPPPQQQQPPMAPAAAPLAQHPPPTERLWWGRLVEQAMDPHGSRLLQDELPTVPHDLAVIAARELAPRLRELSTHVFGNYLLGKLAAVPAFHEAFVAALRGHVASLLCHTQASRVVQAALAALPPRLASPLVGELRGQVARVATDTHGSWGVCAAFKRVPAPFIVGEVGESLGRLAKHQHGIRVVQAVLRDARAASLPEMATCIGELLRDRAELLRLAAHPYANYAVQDALKHGAAEQVAELVAALLPRIQQLATTKHGSNVAEAVLEAADVTQLESTREELLTKAKGGKEATQLDELLAHPFGNYVLQTLLRRLTAKQRVPIIAHIRAKPSKGNAAVLRIILQRFGDKSDKASSKSDAAAEAA